MRLIRKKNNKQNTGLDTIFRDKIESIRLIEFATAAVRAETTTTTTTTTVVANCGKKRFFCRKSAFLN